MFTQYVSNQLLKNPPCPPIEEPTSLFYYQETKKKMHNQASVEPGHIFISAIWLGSFNQEALQKPSLELCRHCYYRYHEDALNTLSLSVEKGLPLGSDHSCSTTASAISVNELFDRKLTDLELVLAGLESESKVSGYHVDNIAPAIMGRFVLTESYERFELMILRFAQDKDLFFVLVCLEFEAPTKKKQG